MSIQGKILVIDDEDSCRSLLVEWLRSYGYQCEEADNGNDGLQQALNQEWDLVLSDIVMPGISGLELVRAVKAFIKQPAPVVLISAVRSLDTIKMAFREGAYDCVFKPFDLAELEMTIMRALEKNRMARTLENYRLTLEQRVADQAEHIRLLTIGSLITLARALEAKDSYTNGHSQRVAEYAVLIAQQLNLDLCTCDRIRLAGQLHDIGKIGMPEFILNKPGKLRDEEYELVKQHPVIGAEIMSPLISDICVLHGIKHHHERFDGKGYPDQLLGDAIPLEARILAVADTYDAITTDRAYRPGASHECALAELQRCASTQFDPIVVEAFISIPYEKITGAVQYIPFVAQWKAELNVPTLPTFSWNLANTALAN